MTKQDATQTQDWRSRPFPHLVGCPADPARMERFDHATTMKVTETQERRVMGRLETDLVTVVKPKTVEVISCQDCGMRTYDGRLGNNRQYVATVPES